jgi:hypothetical protein
MLIAVWLAALAVRVAGAQEAGVFGDDANALQTNPALAQVAISDGSVTNTLQPGQAMNQPGSFSLGPIISEPLNLSMTPWPSNKMTVGGAPGGSFVDPDATQIQGNLLLQRFDLLHADAHGPPVYFGRDKDVKFVESHVNRPGIPAPVGMSYPIRPHRLEFFGEFAPILDATPDNSLGWGGGLGIRFYIGH